LATATKRHKYITDDAAGAAAAADSANFPEKNKQFPATVYLNTQNSDRLLFGSRYAENVAQ